MQISFEVFLLDKKASTLSSFYLNKYYLLIS